ncbi:MAG: class I SAM-dependent methyltransferase [Clostridia bacterium]|nr:class I SAM-dependent methyltransferase [Clostridia bacterium]
MKKYYEAYEQRYRAVHEKNDRWTSDVPTPAVIGTIEKYCDKSKSILEIGCGEGRDAKAVLGAGYDLTAADISPSAVRFCQKLMPQHKDRFIRLDCLNGTHGKKYDMIYAVAVLHMLTDDADREKFYSFIKDHLKDGGSALVCSMGDGETEFCTDPSKAFEPAEREHNGKKIKVASTTCRIVSFDTFEDEIGRAGFEIKEKGVTASPPEFDSLMYAVIRRKK